MHVLWWIPKELIASVHARETYVFRTSNTGCSNVKCEVEFFGRCCVRGRYVRLFFMWADCPLAYYQIADLEDVQVVKVQKKQASDRLRYSTVRIINDYRIDRTRHKLHG